MTRAAAARLTYLHRAQISYALQPRILRYVCTYMHRDRWLNSYEITRGWGTTNRASWLTSSRLPWRQHCLLLPNSHRSAQSLSASSWRGLASHCLCLGLQQSAVEASAATLPAPGEAMSESSSQGREKESRAGTVHLSSHDARPRPALPSSLFCL
jgi:hypothetical protein